MSCAAPAAAAAALRVSRVACFCFFRACTASPCLSVLTYQSCTRIACEYSPSRAQAGYSPSILVLPSMASLHIISTCEATTGRLQAVDALQQVSRAATKLLSHCVPYLWRRGLSTCQGLVEHPGTVEKVCTLQCLAELSPRDCWFLMEEQLREHAGGHMDCANPQLLAWPASAPAAPGGACAGA